MKNLINGLETMGFGDGVVECLIGINFALKHTSKEEMISNLDSFKLSPNEVSEITNYINTK